MTWATTGGSLVVCLTLLALSGCLGGGPSGEPSATTTDSSPATAAPTVSAVQTPPAALDSTLSAFLRADNRTQYARRHGIETEGGRVHVVIGLASGATLPDRLDLVVELQDGDEVLALVSADELAQVARHRNVTAVRIPDRPNPQASDGAVERPVRSDVIRLRSHPHV